MTMKKQILRATAASDRVIWLTPITFGGYAPELKKALDRIIPDPAAFFHPGSAAKRTTPCATRGRGACWPSARRSRKMPTAKASSAAWSGATP